MKWKTLKNIFVLKVPIAIHNVNDYRFKKLNIPCVLRRSVYSYVGTAICLI